MKNQTILGRKSIYNILNHNFNISNTSDQSTSSLIFFLLLPVPIPKTSPSNGRIVALQKEEFRYKNMDSTLPATRKEFSTFIYHQVDSQGLVSVLLIAAMIIPRNIMVSTFMEDTSTLPHTNLDSRLLATCSFSIRKFYQYFNFIQQVLTRRRRSPPS